MASNTRVYGTATFGTFTPFMSTGNITTPVTGTFNSQGTYVARDGVAYLTMRIDYIPTGAPWAGNPLYIVMPGVPQPKYTSAVLANLLGIGLGLGATAVVQGEISNYASISPVITFKQTDQGAGGIPALLIGTDFDALAGGNPSNVIEVSAMYHTA